jgi:preprotein translocase subunit SecE
LIKPRAGRPTDSKKEEIIISEQQESVRLTLQEYMQKVKEEFERDKWAERRELVRDMQVAACSTVLTLVT